MNDQQPAGIEPTEHSSDEVPSPGEAADAALDAVEPERLLPGEDEATVHLDDAVHWTKVYAELLAFKRSLLTVADEHVAAMENAARVEVEETDLKILLAEAERLERRFDFWTERSAALTQGSA
jgi:hypothetical protein